jgi:hypothetical protein
VKAATHDRAARWRRSLRWRWAGAREGVVDNFIFFCRVRTRGSEDAIASGGDVSVRTDARVESLSKENTYPIFFRSQLMLI